MSDTHTITAADLKVDEEWTTVTIDGAAHPIDWFDADSGFATEIHTTDGHTVIVEGR